MFAERQKAMNIKNNDAEFPGGKNRSGSVDGSNSAVCWAAPNNLSSINLLKSFSLISSSVFFLDSPVSNLGLTPNHKEPNRLLYIELIPKTSQ